MAARRRFRAVMLIAFLLICAVIRADCASELTTAGCSTCTSDGQTCTACTNSAYNVQLNGKSCAANCPEHSTAKQNICQCDDGYSLNSAKTACERSVSAGCASELTTAGCSTCTSDGQTCTACTNSAYNVQLNGKSCAANCPEHSTAKQNICQCDDGYSLNSAKTACERSVSAGCASELTTAGCSTCTSDGQTCTACTNSAYNVQLNGKSCAANCPEHSTAKQNICQCDDGYSLNSAKTACEPSSTNKSGLSTGAIAGISVAVIVIVGGLVGFLCWWFLCRGKA
ncbi:VSP [Giardia duodenalis ATCC 50581]|uniref:VSP n=1 Tax=Giardia intestinalis (strain ATCC 50581 / GS clone H7) TaxID=598745 RepID=C6LRD7_GIAIB|nr:VSP [Giardia intestinalis ATCC 50581]